MRVSAKGEYAIRAMLDLAMNYRDGGHTLVPIQDVARRQGIPQRYLEQVLLLLKRDVLRVVEGDLTPVEVARRQPRGRRDAGRDLAELWQEVANAVAAVIDRTTFADLAERAASRRSPNRAMYHI
jgi:DNA-binding IscR family transcriptional regulator